MKITILHNDNNSGETALKNKIASYFENHLPTEETEIVFYDNNFSETDESSDGWLTLSNLLDSDIVAFDLSSKEMIIPFAVGAIAAENKRREKEIIIMAICDDLRIERTLDVGAIYSPIGFDQTIINVILDHGDIFATSEAFIEAVNEFNSTEETNEE